MRAKRGVWGMGHPTLHITLLGEFRLSYDNTSISSDSMRFARFKSGSAEVRTSTKLWSVRDSCISSYLKPYIECTHVPFCIFG
jgi:hypothetical protein